MFRWFSAIDTLALLHSIDPDAIGLGNFGKRKDFYRRHCNTFSRIEAQQALVKDKDTGKLLGRAHEKYDEIVDFVRANAPGERNSIIHGDFKFDNMVSISFLLYYFVGNANMANDAERTCLNRFSIQLSQELLPCLIGNFQRWVIH
jgi:hypothetical protein